MFTWSVATGAVAAEPSLDAARGCGAIDDNFSRLACFDKLFRAAAAPVTAHASAPAPIAAAAAGAAATFGEEALRATDADRVAASSSPSEITAQVTGLREIGRKKYRVTLENGQVWQQEETPAETTREVTVGDTVRIRKRSLGGYLMATVRNGNDNNWIRVTRQK